jgi:hypothetical protein
MGNGYFKPPQAKFQDDVGGVVVVKADKPKTSYRGCCGLMRIDTRHGCCQPFFSPNICCLLIFWLEFPPELR